MASIVGTGWQPSERIFHNRSDRSERERRVRTVAEGVRWAWRGEERLVLPVRRPEDGVELAFEFDVG